MNNKNPELKKVIKGILIVILTLSNLCLISSCKERERIRQRFGDEEYIDHLGSMFPFREHRNGKIMWIS